MERERVMTVSPMATGQAYSVWAAGHAAIPADPMLARQVGTTAERQHRVGRALDLRTVPCFTPTNRPPLCILMQPYVTACILMHSYPYAFLPSGATAGEAGLLGPDAASGQGWH